MSGWVPMPSDLWPVISEGLRLPWSEESARFDLRWHADQGALPARRDLAKRWGWTPDEVRTELRHPERWWDPKKGPPPASRSELTQRRQGLTQVDPKTPELERKEAENTDGVTQNDPTSPGADPTSPHARELDHPHLPPPPPKTDVRPAGRAKPDRYAEVASYFGQVVHQQLGRRPNAGPDRSTKLGQRLLKAVQKDADLVLDAMRYVAEGRGQKADWLRGYDGLTVETVLRHIDEYAELYRAEQHVGTVLPTVGGAHPGRTKPVDPAVDAEAAAFWADLEARGKQKRAEADN